MPGEIDTGGPTVLHCDYRADCPIPIVVLASSTTKRSTERRHSDASSLVSTCSAGITAPARLRVLANNDDEEKEEDDTSRINGPFRCCGREKRKKVVVARTFRHGSVEARGRKKRRQRRAKNGADDEVSRTFRFDEKCVGVREDRKNSEESKDRGERATRRSVEIAGNGEHSSTTNISYLLACRVPSIDATSPAASCDSCGNFFAREKCCTRAQTRRRVDEGGRAFSSHRRSRTRASRQEIGTLASPSSGRRRRRSSSASNYCTLDSQSHGEQVDSFDSERKDRSSEVRETGRKKCACRSDRPYFLQLAVLLFLLAFGHCASLRFSAFRSSAAAGFRPSGFSVLAIGSVVFGAVTAAPLDLIGDAGVRAERSANLSHITGASRKIQMYIKNRHLQILPDGTVNGSNDDTSDYTIFQRTSVSRGQLRIQGVATCLYLCMDSCGLLYGSHEYTEDCVFNETLEQHNYNTYSSVRWSTAKKTLYLGLNRRGQPRRVQAKGHTLGRLSAYARVLTQVAPSDRVEALQKRMLAAAPAHNVRHHHGSRPHHQQHHRGELNAQVCPSAPPQEKDGRDRFRCRKRKKRKKRKRRCRPGEKPGPQCHVPEEISSLDEMSKVPCDSGDANGKLCNSSTASNGGNSSGKRQQQQQLQLPSGKKKKKTRLGVESGTGNGAASASGSAPSSSLPPTFGDHSSSSSSSNNNNNRNNSSEVALVVEEVVDNATTTTGKNNISARSNARKKANIGGDESESKKPDLPLDEKRKKKKKQQKKKGPLATRRNNPSSPLARKRFDYPANNSRNISRSTVTTPTAPRHLTTPWTTEFSRSSSSWPPPPLLTSTVPPPSSSLSRRRTKLFRNRLANSSSSAGASLPFNRPLSSSSSRRNGKALNNASSRRNSSSVKELFNVNDNNNINNNNSNNNNYNNTININNITTTTTATTTTTITTTTITTTTTTVSTTNDSSVSNATAVPDNLFTLARSSPDVGNNVTSFTPYTSTYSSLESSTEDQHSSESTVDSSIANTSLSSVGRPADEGSGSSENPEGDIDATNERSDDAFLERLAM